MKIEGKRTAIGIIQLSSESVQKYILSELSKINRALANSLSDELFLFEDIAKLENYDIQRILRTLTTEEISEALLTSSDNLKHRLFENLSVRAGEVLEEDMATIKSRGGLQGSENAKREIVCRILEEGLIKMQGEYDISVANYYELPQIDGLNEKAIALLLKEEDARNSALVLFSLKIRKASDVLSLLEKPIIIKIIIELLKTNIISENDIQELSRRLTEKVETMKRNFYSENKHSLIANILEVLPPDKRVAYLTHIKEHSKDDYDKINDSMSGLDDTLNLLDVRDIAYLMRDISITTLAHALKGLKEDTVSRIFELIPKRTRDILKEEMETSLTITERDISEARSDILKELNRMAACGIIIFPQKEETPRKKLILEEHTDINKVCENLIHNNIDEIVMVISMLDKDKAAEVLSKIGLAFEKSIVLKMCVTDTLPYEKVEKIERELNSWEY
ncbi:MAG: hypothetical protein HQK98_00875 [Nitrospirae bacterium]|nr:hypothetical protein [Nitrospirota bacterium]